MKWILVATDGSAPSRVAEKRAAELALKLGEGLVLVSVVEPPVQSAENGYPFGSLLDAREQSAKAIVEGDALALAQESLEIKTMVTVGSPAECIAEVAQAADIDMVVTGTHGRGALARLLLGSVATRLSHICSKPLLIVPSERAAG